MADALPPHPGVYTFRGPRGEALYVGTSKNLRSRVKSYFTRGEQRRRMRDMLELAVSVDTVVCPTQIEAQVAEVRLIAQHRPRFNRRSVRPERTTWLRLTDERYPRLSITRSIDGKDAVVGPLRGSADAHAAIEVVQQALGMRTCTTRLPIVPRADARACLLKDLGACAAPCVRGEASGYAEVVAIAQEALSTDPSPVVAAMAHAVAEYAANLDFERAASVRDGVSALIEGSMRAQRLAALRRCDLVAARRNGDQWDLIAVSQGVLTGSARVASGVWAAADTLRATYGMVAESPAGVEERELVAKWLEREGTRLLYVDGEWSQPVASAGRHQGWVDARSADRDSRIVSGHRLAS